MLERFKVSAKDQVRVSEQSLRTTVAALFEKSGVPPEDAAEGANTLVMTDLRGVESHGVSNMMPHYIRKYQDGSLNPTPQWRIVRESPGTATIDADKGLGIIVAPRAMRIAIEKARSAGVGAVTLVNGGHTGAIGHHAVLAAREDMVGMCMTTGANVMAPTFGAEGRLGTNPIAIAAPARNEAPFLFDAATSVVADNKITLARRNGANLLPGWIADKDGIPIMEEVPAPEFGEYFQLPLGSTREQGSHKGYGLAVMAEVLCSVLGGGLPGVLGMTYGNNAFFGAAYNIASFTDVDAFKDTMDEMLRKLKNTPPARGHDRVLYAGLPEYEEEQDRRANGIPLHREVVQWFDDVAGEMSAPRLVRM